MKKKLICLGVLLLALTACGQKKHGKTDSSSVQKSNSAKIESFNKENRNLLEKAEEQQVFTKHFVLPTDEKGIRQEQTITYQGEQLQKLVMTNTTPASDELIAAVGPPDWPTIKFFLSIAFSSPNLFFPNQLH